MLLLVPAASAQTTKRPARKGRAYAVHIDSSPQQATIYLDDKSYGTVGYTPYTGRLVGGSYRLILEVPGYRTVEQQITVSATSHDFSFTLEKSGGTLDVRADADPNLAGAKVFVDGEPKGAVPLSMPIPTGRALIEIKKQGYPDVSQWIDVKPGERVTLTPQLRAQQLRGGLLVDADAPQASVSVDGKEIPDTTPALVDNLEVGPHVVEVRKAGSQPWKTTVEVKAGVRTKVTAELGKGTGSIKVLTNRDDAEVWLDGEAKGKPPLELPNLAPGAHLVEVRAKGWKPREERVNVQSGQSTVLKLDVTDKAIAGTIGRIRVISPVPEAEVLIDGAPVGNAPYESDVAAGPHYVSVQKAGFGRFEKQIAVDEGKTTSVTADLRAAGGLRVIANVDGAEVLLDGRPVGRTPLVLETIESGDHVVTVRQPGFADQVSKIRVDGGQQASVNAVLAEDPSKIKRGLSSWGANTIPAGRFTVDVGTGYPYYLELRGTSGVTDSRFLSWDFGVEFRSLGLLGTWEFLATGRVRLMQVSPFAFAVFGTVGAGGGTYSGRGEVTLQGGAIGTLQMTNIIAISARGWLDFWSDRLCKEPEMGQTVSASGPDVCTGTASPEDQAKALSLTGGNLYNRDAGLRLYLSLAVEGGVTENMSLYFIFEGAPFQDERAGHSNLFTSTLAGRDDPIYNARLGLTFKF
jgi:hypothetical protein